MGLSASQARLLTITARKSDCEFQSMRYSHQKIALSRSMTDLSTKYQNSLDQTKLVYDFYGESDTTTPLSYGLLMTPSQMNGYLPTLITDASGKVVLSSPYAAAARAAGIPQEGLGCLPSSTTRNKFLEALAKNGVISNETAKTCMDIQYSQSIGFGTTDIVAAKAVELNIDELLDKIDASGFRIDLSGSELAGDGNSRICINNGNQASLSDWFGSGNTITMRELFESDYTVFSTTADKDGDYARFHDDAVRISQLNCWEQIIDAFTLALDDGTALSKAALDYATQKTRDLVYFSDLQYLDSDGNAVSGTVMTSPNNDAPAETGGWGCYETGYKYTNKKRSKAEAKSRENASKYIGYYGFDSRNSGFGWGLKKNQVDTVGISISNIAKAFLTYYIQYIEGANNPYANLNNDAGMTINGGNGNHGTGHNNYANVDGTSRSVASNNLVSLDTDYTFTYMETEGINTDQALISGFYDAIFNQLCTRGWVENNNITDNDYMQEMLKTGKLFLATCADDGYYYQGNYATNTYIKEVTDEEAIAKAEAEYNTEKQKLTHKEEIIDLKMKNLDTEISSLTTEYDTIKSVISKNIEKSFKRYDA